MLTKLSKIQKFTRIENCNWDANNKPFAKNNLIYGPNGVGKTTITNILGLISLNSMESKEKVLTEYTSGDEFVFECEYDGKKRRIDSKNKSLTEKISIFNSAFVHSHVFNGTNLKTKEFSEVVTQEQLSNPEIKRINERLEEIVKSISTESEIKKDVEKVFLKKKSDVSSMHNGKTSEFRMPPINIRSGVEVKEKSSDIIATLDSLYLSYSQAKNSSALEQEIQKINSVILESIIEGWDVLNGVLNRSIKESTENRMKNLIHVLSQDEDLGHENWASWFANANSLIKFVEKKENLNCPVCNSDLTGRIEKILGEFSDLFTEEIENLNQEIDEWLGNISESERIIGQNVQKLVSLNAPIKTLNIESKIKNKHDPEISSIKMKLTTLKKNLEGKKGNFSKVYDCIELLTGITIESKKFNQGCKDYLQEVKEEAKKLNDGLGQPKKIEQEIKKLLEILVYTKTNEDLENGKTVESFFEAQREIERLTKEEIALKKTLSDELQKLRNESKLLNYYLKRLGFHNFSVDFKVKSIHGIAVRYGDITRTDLSYCLSEGEKTALAFSYFLSKINHEIIQNVSEKIEDHVVIIDDPISSLDENRLNSTAFLIHHIFQSFRQLFVFSHNLTFLKVMGSQFEASDREDYYLEYDSGTLTIKHTPYELTNYGTTYFLKLKELIEVNKGTINYEEAKKFVPNYVRIVLETYLSFKFFIVKQRGKNDKYRTPGLDKMIKYLSGNLNLFNKNLPKGVINSDNFLVELENIKRITDGHSHGGGQLLDEYIFLSKRELDSLITDTLDILNFLDQIHMDEVLRDRA